MNRYLLVLPLFVMLCAGVMAFDTNSAFGGVATTPDGVLSDSTNYISTWTSLGSGYGFLRMQGKNALGKTVSFNTPLRFNTVLENNENVLVVSNLPSVGTYYIQGSLPRFTKCQSTVYVLDKLTNKISATAVCSAGIFDVSGMSR